MTSSNRLDRIAFLILQITLFFAPIFFIPSTSVPFAAGKSVFILYGILAALVFWIMARLKDGVFEAPKSLFYASSGILAFFYALAGIFSAGRDASFAGPVLDVSTLSFFIPSLILFALVPLLARSEKDIIRLYASFFLSFFVITLFHIIRLAFGPDTLSFGVFTSATATLIGKWNDLGIFFGLSALLSLVSIERLSLPRVSKILAYTIFFASLALLIVINFAPAWVVLAAISLLLFVYKFSFEGRNAPQGRISHLSIVVLAVSLFFIFGAGLFSGMVADKLGTSQIEVRPSWSATYEIARTAISDNPLFGAGPNRFSSEWLLHKPLGINSTVFWNVGFNYGIGFIPSFIVTSGLLGFAAAILFIASFVLLVRKALLKREGNPLSRYVAISSFFASLYLWTFAVIYVPSASIWILTLVFSGICVAALRVEGAISTKEYSTVDKPAAGFVSVLLLILLLISSVAFAYFVTIKFIAGVSFQKGVVAVNSQGDFDLGERAIARAISFSPSDVYYQTLAELYVARLNILFEDTKITQAEAQKQFQALLAAAIESAQSAVSFDPTNYANHAVLAKVFASVVPLNITGAYESAKKSYEDALARSPESPEILLNLARLELAKKDNAAAKAYIAKAVEKKGDYADAIFLLAQIQIAEKDVPNAINSVSAVATLQPTEPGIFFQLGILYYSSKDYPKAVAAFERAVALNGQYANARYFLGLSYYQVKDTAGALKEFREIKKTNPDNAEVDSIIKNLESGKEPFSVATNPTKRSTLPVKQ